MVLGWMAVRRETHGKFGILKRAKYLQLLRKGGRREASARACGVSPDLIYLLKKEDAEFAEEAEKAEMEANSLVENALFKAAIHGNVVACQVWLYNRAPDRWTDRRQFDHKSEVTVV